MSFEDPFAGDLKSITAMMADFDPSRPKAASTTMSSRMAPVNTATPAPLPNPSASNLGVAPRTGRRAAQPVDTGASMGGLGAPTSRSAGPPPAFATQPRDELSWLDDPPLLRPPIKDHAAPEPPVQQPTVIARSAALDDNPWDFLSEVTTGAMGEAAMDTPATAPPISTAAAAAAAKRAEETATLRDLQATLLALDSELSGLEDRLTTREIKEEAELTHLTTTVMEKRLELEQQDTAHDSTKAEVEHNTARRLDSMAQRYADELAELEAEVRLQEGTRLQRQVKQLQNALNEANSNIEQLERQRALVVAESPYSKQGVLLALSAAENTSAAPHDDMHEGHRTVERRGSHRGSNNRSNTSILVSHTPPTSSAGSSRRSSSATPSVPEAPVSPLEMALRTAVGVLQQYYQQRISSLKDNIVDYLHEETIDVAHESRTRHCLGLVQEATDRKSQFAAYIVEMTKRYLDACRDREALKQRNMQSLHSEIQADASRLRAEAAARLETLTTEVTARWQVAVQQFEATASASRDALERRAHFTDEGDRSIATSQRAQLEGRCETERSVRHRLWMTERETLSMQLAKMRAHGDAVDSERWRGLMQTALSSSEACGLQELLKQLANLRLVAETNTEEEQRRATGAPPRWQGAAVVAAADCTEEDILRMNATEATHTIASLLREVQLRQEKLAIAWSRSRQMREVTCLQLEEAAVTLVDRRHAQQSHQSAVDFARVMWERDHRANLSASLQLEIPIGLREQLLGTATHASPADVTVVGLVELVVNQLDTLKTRMAHLRSERRALLEDHTTDLSCLAEAHGVLREMTGRVEEMHTEQHRASEVLFHQQLAVYQETLRAQAAVEALEAQRSDLQARRESTERAMRLCQEESAEVLDSYERHKTHLQHLADEQLRLAQTHHELTVQQRLQSFQQGVVSHRHQQRVDVLNTAARPLDVSARPHTSALHDYGGFSNNHGPARTGVATANCTPPQERTAPSAHSSGIMRSQSSTTRKGILEDDNRIGSLPDKDHKPMKQQPQTWRDLPEAVTTVPRHQSTYENAVLSPSSEPHARLDDHSSVSGSSFQYHSSTFMDLVTVGDSLSMSSA